MCGTSDTGMVFSDKKYMSYQAMKRHGGTLKFILLSERSQPEKATHCMIPTI